MRKTGWTPSIVPEGSDTGYREAQIFHEPEVFHEAQIFREPQNRNVYLVVDDFGRNGQVYRETDVEAADLETVISDLLAGQYQNPVRVVAFNSSERWSQDISSGVAHELRRRCDLQLRDVPFFLELFVERYEGRYHDLQLPLPLRLA